jgi:hypothetical protein
MPDDDNGQIRAALTLSRRNALLLGAGGALAALAASTVDVLAAPPLDEFVFGFDDPAYDGDLPPLPPTWTKGPPPWSSGRRHPAGPAAGSKP